MFTQISQQWLHSAIIERSSDAVLFADRRGTIMLWNAAAEALFGFSQHEALGQSLDIIIPENLRARHWEGYHRVMQTGETKYLTGLLSAPGLKKDGSRISLEFSMSVIRSEAGDIVGCSSMIRDVTERWLKEKEMKARLKELGG